MIITNNTLKQISFKIAGKDTFQRQVLERFSDVQNLVFINKNSAEANLIAVANTNNKEGNWQFGFVSYDYKNEIETQLSSENADYIQFAEKHFFSPELLFIISGNEVEIQYEKTIYTEEQITKLFTEITQLELSSTSNESVKMTPRLSKDEYLAKVKALQQHIQLGDIYEVNFCQEFYAENVAINPIHIYHKLNKKSPTPFSCFVKHNDNYLLCASPERFIKKMGDEISSQPIKGTIKRGNSEAEDTLLREQLKNDPKEHSENVMIVDLVRNDLSKIAKKGSVKVDELCGIYTFPQVHQMISTVSAKVEEGVNFDDVLKATFPMGSMTGAPKVRAMELIEEYETTKRGLYSGTVGFIDYKGDFDFNVVIRSITYNQKNNYLSYMVGGAITALSDPKKEYEECLLKAKAMLEVLTEK
ncbi:MAG: aminodeoxychorismate synthase component I [Flavobacteriales bacterium]|nr:aminodeoxychorismate synthase component I [Flavobacteriales bacterium]MCB9362938.1 aminodeoxychorismate synthase component I [Flavobacteriales bacterium]